MSKKTLSITQPATPPTSFGIFFLIGKLKTQFRQSNKAKSSNFQNGDSYDLRAEYVEKEINGKKFTMLGYNGMIPGPTIKVAQGSEITINFKNGFDMETTLHSHGVRMDNEFDGAPPVTQAPIKPGETFTYKLKFPDVGMYWYHPMCARIISKNSDCMVITMLSHLMKNTGRKSTKKYLCLLMIY